MDHFEYHEGEYYAEDVAITKLAREVGTPFFCYSASTLERHANVFRDALQPLNAKCCYAVKANGHIAILRTLSRAGFGADVVSEGEIRLALEAGVSPNDIVFSGVGKTREEMAYALARDIFQFNVESEAELHLLNEVAVSIHRPARVAIRINPDVASETHAKISTGGKETKFGIALAQAMSAFRTANALPGIELQGVSVHIGSQLTTLEPFARAFSVVREFVQELHAQGIHLKVIDLGGGLGIPYGGEGAATPPLPMSYAQVVKQAFSDMSGVQFVFEPGRLIVGNSGILVTRVIYVKHTAHKIFVIVDAGMNDLVRPTLYNAYHDIVHVQVPDGAAATEWVDIVGPVCETGDYFAQNRLLKLPKEGDLLAIRTTGAYGAVMASTYNARPIAAEVMVRGHHHAVIRPRQTYDQMLAEQKLPPWLT